jgi:hypothetical protein
MKSAFALLVAHFFGRFFDNEIVSQRCDMRTDVVQALGLLAVPGMFVAFYMLPQQVSFRHLFEQHWLLIGDYYFFVLYSMVVMGFVMVLEWDALFPDRRDYLCLTPLPLGGRSIFFAKLTALLLFLGLFVLDANLLGSLIGPVVATDATMHGALIWRLIGIHIAGVLGAGGFVALAFAGIQGVLINVLTARAFRRISPWVQMTLMALLVTVLFLTPLICMSLRPLFENHSPLLRWFPPFWFLALYIDMLPGRPGGTMFHELAPLARYALGIAAAVFAFSYLAGYQRHTRSVMESLETAGEGPGRLRVWFRRFVNSRLLPHPLERATFHFIGNTILRSPRHRLFLATYAGIAMAIAIATLVRIGARPGAPVVMFVASGLLAIPLSMSFFAVTGLRAAFNLPAELRANWIFQVCENEDRIRHIAASRKWIIFMGLLPLFAILTPFEIYFRGPWLASIHITFALALSLVLLEVLLVWFRKIPFTCSYFPGKTSMAVLALLYLAGFLIYAGTMATLQSQWVDSPLQLLAFYLTTGAALFGLAWLERREFGINDALIYEDEPEPIVRQLELG